MAEGTNNDIYVVKTNAAGMSSDSVKGRFIIDFKAPIRNKGELDYSTALLGTISKLADATKD